MRARGQGHIYQRGPWLWVNYFHNGRHVREAAKDAKGQNTADWQTAEKFLKVKLTAITTEQGGGPQFLTPTMRRLTIHDLLETLKAKYIEKGQDSPQNLSLLKKADGIFGDKRALACTPKIFADWKRGELEAGKPLATVQRPLQTIRAAYRLAVKRAELPRAPYIEMSDEHGNARQGFFTDKQLGDLLAALPDDGLRDFVEWASLTGQRKSEIAAMTWGMLEGNEIRIPAGFCKNRLARALPVCPELAVILERRKRARKVISLDGTATMSERIFHRGDGLEIGDFKKSWATACKKAACPGRLLHDLRRNFARELLAAGVSQAVSMKLGGWETDSVFRRYALAGEAALLADAQKKVAEFRRQLAVSR